MQKHDYLTELLIDLGLSEHESKVYLASLSRGPATVMDIADTADVKRTTVYSVVDSLMKKGLMRIQPKGFKRFFQAEDPGRLESVLESRRYKLRNALPQLEALYNLKGGESVLRYYEGLAGMQAAHEEILSSAHPNDYYYVINNGDMWLGLDKEYFTNYRNRRKKINLQVKLILQNTPEGREIYKNQRNYNSEARLLPEGVSINAQMILIPQKVMIQELVSPVVTIMIENPGVIKMQKEMFEIAWNALSV